MSSMEALRQKLYSVWEKGSSKEILRISQELDVEIVKYMKSSLVSQNQLIEGKDKHRQPNLIKKSDVNISEIPATQSTKVVLHK